MNKITFEDAVGHFSRNAGHWEAFINGIKEQREVGFSNVRACMNCPDSLDHQYWVRVGEMMGVDDLVYKLESTARECEFEDLQKAQEEPIG